MSRTEVKIAPGIVSDDAPLILQPNERIYMAQGQSVSINVVAEWADY